MKELIAVFLVATALYGTHAVQAGVGTRSCGVSIETASEIVRQTHATMISGPVAEDFLKGFNAEPPVTDFVAPIWLKDHPEDGTLDLLLMGRETGCVLVIPDPVRSVLIRRLLGESM